MSNGSSSRRDGPSFALLALCFFGSGLTALIYELLWTRRLQEVFGSTTYSITTVLAAFMAGLGLGSYVIGRRVDRSGKSALQTYAQLELAVGLYALASLPLLGAVEWVYGALQSRMQLGQGGAALLKLVLSFPVLALPAGLMGGTLPALVRGVLRSRADLHSTVGRLYGINTAGAALGTALAGMLMIEFLGLWRSMVLGASVNLVIGVVVLTRLRGAETEQPPEPDPAARAPRLRQHLRNRAVLFCAVAVTFTGLLSMLYEIIWTRILTLVFGSSTYAFTIVLAIFLVGIAGGALIYGRASRRRPPTAFGLTLALLALALWVMISLVIIPAIPHLLVNLAQFPGVDFMRVLSFELLFALFILLVPTLLLGAALPMSMGIISRSLGQVGQDVGGVYLVNTAGAIVGSVLTGFLLVPLIGTQTTLLAGLLANLLLAGFGVLSFGGPRRIRALGSAVVLVVGAVALAQPPWPPEVFDSGLGFRLDQCAAANKLELYKALRRTPNKLLAREEGRNATITVRHFSRGVSLLVNGKPDASTGRDMLTQVVLGVLATAAHPDPRQVAVVGWGSGVTTYTVTFFPEVQQIDTIEIEPAVVRASRFFHGVNGAVERHPRVRVIYDDARSYLLTTDKRYDLVISEPSNPWMAGVAALFSRDYYLRAKERLNPGGVFGQWLQLYRMDARGIALILRTMLASFRDVQLWASDPYNVILLGSDRPIRMDYGRVKRAYRVSRLLSRHMGVYGPGVQPEHLYGCYLLDRAGIEQVVRRFPAELMTDDRPILEYRALRNLYGKHHRHIDSLVRAKIRLGKELPPGNGGAPPGLALAGAAHLFRNVPALFERLTRWGLERHPDEPQLRLARAKALVTVDRLQAGRAMLEQLPRQPGYMAEAALLDARILLMQGNPIDALRRLDDMGRFRPTAKLVYQLNAAVEGGQWDMAWTFAERLVKSFGDHSWDIDARQLLRQRVYSKIRILTRRSKEYTRAIRLLTSRKERYGGEIDRLWALANAYHDAGRTELAAKTMDRVMDYDLVTQKSLRLCVKVYRAVKAEQTARACRHMLLAAGLQPAGEPLYK